MGLFGNGKPRLCSTCRWWQAAHDGDPIDPEPGPDGTMVVTIRLPRGAQTRVAVRTSATPAETTYPSLDEVRWGECRANPPPWPTTRAGDGCGRWEAR